MADKTEQITKREIQEKWQRIYNNSAKIDVLQEIITLQRYDQQRQLLDRVIVDIIAS